MGKKKVAQKIEETSAEEQKKAPAEKAEVKISAKGKKIPKGNVYIQATYNNTIITICDLNGNVLAWASSGNLGFKGPRKATPFAASKVAETVIEKVRKVGMEDVSVFVRGIGSGRESAIRSIASRGLNIVFIKDMTPVPHNGCRAKKVRRV